ncbi:eukaryotic translation initiation factor 4E type 3 [Endogone sp. FLAS-F59071]|nr:eukaryotic translation initiation factor 4E type 3 [Endogone sp. FLAS-F59071]|eukprot:RUS16437.1 eukaryotic translation initiation factor 4E type 3 [Endogone sp. FLAS-F59071]
MEDSNPWITKKSSTRLAINTEPPVNPPSKDSLTPTSATNSSGAKLVQLQRQNSITSISLTPTTPGFASAGAAGGFFTYASSSQPGAPVGPLSPTTSSGRKFSTTLASTNGTANGGGTGNSGGGSSGGEEERGLMNLSGAVGGGAGTTGGEIHPLHFTWVFWFMHRPPGAKILNYESSMKKIAAFASVEDFWAVYSHLRRPHELPNISDYHLFKQGVRPVWEDEFNINGGKWIVRLKKGLASRYWEALVVAIIGDQFDVGQEICGAVLSIRSSEDILSVWNQSAHEGRINLKIRDTMKRVLNLPNDTIMEYKTHNDALKDNSSFRNTDVFR